MASGNPSTPSPGIIGQAPGAGPGGGWGPPPGDGVPLPPLAVVVGPTDVGNLGVAPPPPSPIGPPGV